MKIFKLVCLPFFLMVFFSCNHDSPGDQILPRHNIKDIGASDKQEIFGEWSMCSIVSGGMMTQMNVCPKVDFKLDGMGSVDMNSVITENFIWTLKNNKLRITNGYRKPNSTFPDSSYFAYFVKNKHGLDLTLRQGDDEYYLSRSLHPE